MMRAKRILIIQTAFLGDVVLTLPLAQAVKDFFGVSEVDVLVVPRAAGLLANHPALHTVIEYDKRGGDRGVKGFLRIVNMIRSRKYDLCLVPHRSLRSALLAFFGGVPIRVGFNKSAGWFFFNKTVEYRDDLHEVDRNLALLEGVGIERPGRILPRLYPSDADQQQVNDVLSGVVDRQRLIGIAPGTIWNTKRWLKERFAALSAKLAHEGFSVVLVGGKEDEQLCREVQELSSSSRVYNCAGALTPLQSAELIRRCRVLVSNDSAPTHFAVAVGTPVVAIFGATVPAFGFAPIGPYDSVVETRGLECRPCSIHGGDKCPIDTFECMKAITHEKVLDRVHQVLKRIGRQ